LRVRGSELKLAAEDAPQVVSSVTVELEGLTHRTEDLPSVRAVGVDLNDLPSAIKIFDSVATDHLRRLNAEGLTVHSLERFYKSHFGPCLRELSLRLSHRNAATGDPIPIDRKKLEQPLWA
jgi:hypothetical protein